MPPPPGFNAALFLYLNPEVAASGPEDVFARWDANAAEWGALRAELPELPAGFDPRVYLATRADVSGLNRAVRDAMVREGAAPSAAAVDAQSQFVATLGSAPARLVATNTFSVPPDVVAGSNLRPGDRVRVLRPRLGHVEGAVVSVSAAPPSFVMSNACYAVEAHAGAGAEAYELYGIRVADPVRQALVALSRAGAELAAPPSADVATLSNTVVVDPGYEPDTYRTLYPDARALSYEDAYLDHVGRWTRGEAFRATRGSDLVNSRAPFHTFRNLTVDALGVGMPYPDRALTGAGVAVEGDIFTTGMVVTQSDERAKASLARIDDPLGRVRLLTGYTYEAAGEAAAARRHAGLLAQDVLRALPEAVYGGTPGMHSVAYGNLAGLFAEAIKEVAARLEAVEGGRRQ